MRPHCTGLALSDNNQCKYDTWDPGNCELTLYNGQCCQNGHTQAAIISKSKTFFCSQNCQNVKGFFMNYEINTRHVLI